MKDYELKKEPVEEDAPESHVLLAKDRKIICRTKCINPPSEMPVIWNISSIIRLGMDDNLSGLASCFLRPTPENPHQAREWKLFMGFLQKYKKVAIAKLDSFKFYILPPQEGSALSHATVVYGKEELACVSNREKDVGFGNSIKRTKRGSQSRQPSPFEEVAISNSLSPENKLSDVETNSQHRMSAGHCGFVKRNFVQAHPSYLKTLGHAHSGWIFGAIAELVDNSRDAKATILKISIDMIYSKIAGKDIPMLSVLDDGNGMTHEEILRMISFGHKQPEVDDLEFIGRFGIGFKTGAMRLGKDALVITQTTTSRSIAFLSQSVNEGRENLEIPIVSYRRIGQFMEVDTTIQDEASCKYNLKAIKEFSPFDKYLIGEKIGLFIGEGTGTQIYIWNLDEWGSSYCLEWESGMNGGSSFHQGDIFIRSRRVRTRPGQMSQAVYLDYSLRSYLEVIFFDPRMKIYLQGAQVKSRPLAKSLNKTVVKSGMILGKPVQLTLGRSQLEWEQANCGIFLYWHGRLIEAYKRVGSMIHNGDKGRGIIGVIDVTDLMDDGDGRVWVHSNKQGFQDCEAYAELEKWLAETTDEYLDKYVDKIPLKKGNARYKPDHEWVQCDKCRKWRRLGSGFSGESLPPEWFCYMKPFNGKCDVPEEKVGCGVITISEKRTRYKPKEDASGFEDEPYREATFNLVSGFEDKPYTEATFNLVSGFEDKPYTEATFNLGGCHNSSQIEDRDVPPRIARGSMKRRRGPRRHRSIMK